MEQSSRGASYGIILSIVCVVIVIAVAFFVFNLMRSGRNQETKGVAVAASSIPSSLDPTAFKGPSGSFMINQPIGWGVDTSEPSIHVAFINPVSDSDGFGEFKANINVARIDSVNASLDGFMDTTKENQKSTLINYQEVRDEKVTIGKTPARLIEATFLNSNRLQHIAQLVAVHDNNAYIVTGTTIDAAWEKQRTLIFDSLKTLRLPE